MTGLDRQPSLTGQGLHLRPLRKDDFAGLFRAASDPGIWAGHPAKTRWQEDVFGPYFDFLLSAGGTLAVTEAATGNIIGCSRYYTAPDVPGSVCIGFTFVTRDHWGGATNRAMKTLMLDHAFTSHDAVWLHIAPDNIRSQKATAKLGARFMYDKVLDLGTGAALNKCYRLDRADWTVT